MDNAETEILEAMGLDVGDCVLLDSSAVIGYVEGTGRTKETMDAVVGATTWGGLKLRASAVAWTELLRAALTADTSLAYRRFLSDSTRIVIVPVDVAVAYAASGMLAAFDRRTGQDGSKRAAESRAFFADAIHLASAVVGRCKAVLTNDREWKDAAPPSLRVIVLDELAAAYSLSRLQHVVGPDNREQS